MRIYEDLLDQIDASDLQSHKSTRDIATTDADAVVYDYSDIDSQNYDYLIQFDMNWLRPESGFHGTRPEDYRRVFDRVCDGIDDFLDSMRAVRSHSNAFVQTYCENYRDCSPRIIWDDSKKGHSLRLIFAFSASFTNMRRLLTFICGIYTIANWQGKKAGTWEHDQVFRLHLKDSMNNGWRSLHTISGQAMRILPKILKSGSKGLSDKEKRFQLRDLYSFSEYLFNGPKIKLTEQFIAVTGDDQTGQLFSSAIRFIDNGVEGNKQIKSVKLSAKMRDMLMSAVYDEDTLKRIAHQSYIQYTTFPTPQSPQRESLDSSAWKTGNFFKKELTLHPRSASKFVLKTIHGGIEFVFCAYLGLFDIVDERGTVFEPMQLIILFGGDVYHPEAYAKFENLLGDKFDKDVFDDMFDNMVANSE